jgi:hypothetical protein
MVFKSITTRKTHGGYTVTVYMRDGELVKQLVAGINRFFEVVEQQKQAQQTLKIPKLEVKHVS